MSHQQLPTTQRAWVLPELGQQLQFVTDHAVTHPSSLLPGQCLVKLTHSGVCRSDLYIVKGHFSPPKKQLVGGHEGIGEIIAIGPGTVSSPVKLGQRVGIKYIAESCLCCEHCLSGNDCYCTKTKRTGGSVDGTFCEYAVSYVDHVTPIPHELQSADAAALMCAGLAASSAVKQSHIQPGEWVVVVGAGGGLGHYVLQLAKLCGARVVAVDTGEAKRSLALSLGADAWVDCKTSDVVADVKSATDGEGAHVVIVAAGSPDAYKDVALILRARGRLMAVGLPPQTKLDIPVLLLAGKGLSVQGVFVGTRQAAIEIVKLAASGKIRSHYSIRGLSELAKVYEELEQHQTMGRIVLDISR